MASTSLAPPCEWKVPPHAVPAGGWSTTHSCRNPSRAGQSTELLDADCNSHDGFHVTTPGCDVRHNLH